MQKYKLIIITLTFIGFFFSTTNSYSGQIVYKTLTLTGVASERERAILNAVSKGICKVNNIGNSNNGKCKKRKLSSSKNYLSN